MLNEFGMTPEEEYLFKRIAIVAEKIGEIITDLTPLHPVTHHLLNALDELFETFTIIAPQVNIDDYGKGAK